MDFLLQSKTPEWICVNLSAGVSFKETADTQMILIPVSETFFPPPPDVVLAAFLTHNVQATLSLLPMNGDFS